MDTRINNLGNIAFKKAIKYRSQSADLDTEFRDERRKNARGEGKDFRGNRRHHKIDVEHYITQNEKDYKTAFTRYKFVSVDKMVKILKKDHKHTTPVAKRNYLKTKGYEIVEEWPQYVIFDRSTSSCPRPSTAAPSPPPRTPTPGARGAGGTPCRGRAVKGQTKYFGQLFKCPMGTSMAFTKGPQGHKRVLQGSHIKGNMVKNAVSVNRLKSLRPICFCRFQASWTRAFS